jgi:transcriptional regulator with XRE-family HTH domain
MRDDDALRQFGTNMKVARVRAHKTQEQVADIAKCSRGYYAAAERGEVNASISTALRFARALEVDLAELMTGVIGRVE